MWLSGLLVLSLGALLVAWALSADEHWAEQHVLPFYCATHPAEGVLTPALRWLAGALGVVLAVKIAPAAARWAGRASLRAWAGSLAGIAIAVAASLGVTELYMRRLHQRIGFDDPPPLAGDRAGSMASLDPRLGWSYVPRRTTWVRMGDRPVAYAIDAEGDRAPSAEHLTDPARPTVLFTGESVAFGYGLPYEETVPFLVGRDLHVQAVNLAVVGYGNDQAYLRVLDALPRYRHPLAVVTFFLTRQIRRNVDPWRPRLALGPGGALDLVAPAAGPRIVRLLQELPFHGDEALRVTAAILRATAEAARARGAYPLFVVTNYGLPCLHADGGEPWVVDQLLVRQQLPFVRVDLGPEDRLPVLAEKHPGLPGSRKIADAVERALSERLGPSLAGAAASP